MAHGYPDWWNMQVPGMAIYSGGQEAWYAVQEADIPGGLTALLINYPVPPRRELHICGGLICCDYPRLQRCSLNWSPALLGTITYDTILILPLHPSATYPIASGNTVEVLTYNDDPVVQHHFTVSLIGFLVEAA